MAEQLNDKGRWFIKTLYDYMRGEWDGYCPKCGRKMYEDKGVLEQLAEKQNNLSATNKAWSDVIEKNRYVR